MSLLIRPGCNFGGVDKIQSSQTTVRPSPVSLKCYQNSRQQPEMHASGTDYSEGTKVGTTFDSNIIGDDWKKEYIKYLGSPLLKVEPPNEVSKGPVSQADFAIPPIHNISLQNRLLKHGLKLDSSCKYMYILATPSPN